MFLVGTTKYKQRSEKVVALPAKRPPLVRARRLATEISQLREVKRLIVEEGTSNSVWSAPRRRLAAPAHHLAARGAAR